MPPDVYAMFKNINVIHAHLFALFHSVLFWKSFLGVLGYELVFGWGHKKILQDFALYM